MISTDKYYANFLKNNFKETKITVAKWNAQIFKVNIKHILINTIIITILTALCSAAIIGLISLLLMVVANTGVPYFGSIILASTIAGLLIGLLGFSKLSIFLKVDEGFYALISLNNSLQGEFFGHGSTSERSDYHLTDGSFRKIVPIIFNPILFDLEPIPIELAPYDDFIYENVRASNGVAFSGTDSALPFVHDPWTFIRLIKSAGKKALQARIREISLEALNIAYDDTSSDVIMGKDGSTALNQAYANALGQNAECHKPAETFYSNEIPGGEATFCIDGTGLCVRFLIKTSVPPESLQTSYNKRRSATIDGEALKITQAAKDKAVSLAMDAAKILYDQIYNENDTNKPVFNFDKIRQDIMIQMDEFKSEAIIQLAGTNGDLGPLESILATVLSKNKILT